MLCGVAHDINNILAAVHSQLFMAKVKGQIHDDIHRRLEESIDLISEMTKNLLGYAQNRDDSSPKENMCIGTSIESTVWIYRYMGASNAVLDTQLETDVYILGHTASLQNMMLNLLINAGHAVEGKDKPEIKIKLSHIENNAVIEIKDNGSGMTKELTAKIFDPFFSTKGTGNGMGMMMVKECVESHGGIIDVKSHAGKGTTFVIQLPLLT